jgi:hypothetical protein
MYICQTLLRTPKYLGVYISTVVYYGVHKKSRRGPLIFLVKFNFYNHNKLLGSTLRSFLEAHKILTMMIMKITFAAILFLGRVLQNYNI